MRDQIRLLGWLFIIYHGFSLVILMLIATVVGVAGLFSGEVELMALASVVASGLFVLSMVTVMPGILAGWGLLNFKPWARILAIIVSVLDIWSIPIGTALAVFALYVLVSGKSDRVFSRRYDYHYG